MTLLSAGVPAVVIDVDTFSSYPDDVVRKVTWNSDLVSKLAVAFDELAAAPQERARLGQAALQYVRDRHSWSRSAELYMEAIEVAYERRQSHRRMTSESGAAFHGERAA